MSSAGSNAFRSHLMQQFAATARNQARPPLALVNWLAEEFEPANAIHNNTTTSSSSSNNEDYHQDQILNRRASWRRPQVSTATGSATSSIVRTNMMHTSSSRRRPSSIISSPPRQQQVQHCFSNLAISSVDKDGDDDDEQALEETATMTTTKDTDCGGSKKKGNSTISSATISSTNNFQSLILTRRTTSHFGSCNEETAFLFDRTYWSQVIDRAVVCGRSAPNHKLTEPFTFKRILGPSDTTQKLAQIAYELSIRKNKTSNEGIAQRKYDKWNSIPAYLVTTVKCTTIQDNSNQEEDGGTADPYEQLPFVPPSTERDLENYASACAAVQNVLLSLHSENIASKWATGPVINTSAFRNLIKASSYDRIVALIMIGLPNNNNNNSSATTVTSTGTSRNSSNMPRRRRNLNDILEDI